MADTVSIRDLSVSAVIGVHDWERETEQTLVFDVDMAADVAKAAASDDIADALDYSVVAGMVRRIVTEGKFQLIETAAERVAERLLAEHTLGWVRVRVTKPLPGEGYTAMVAVERGTSRSRALREPVRAGDLDPLVGHVFRVSGCPECPTEDRYVTPGGRFDCSFGCYSSPGVSHFGCAGVAGVWFAMLCRSPPRPGHGKVLVSYGDHHRKPKLLAS